MINRAVLLLAATWAFGVAGVAWGSEVIGFDDIATGSVSNPYQGFNWYGGGVISSSNLSGWYGLSVTFPSPGQGMAQRNELNDTVLTIELEDDSAAFDFEEAQFRGIGYTGTGGPCWAETLDFIGVKSDHSPVSHTSVSIEHTSWTHVAFVDMTDLVSLEISGHSPGSYCNSMWMMDDFTYTVPEPGATCQIGIAIASIMGLAGLRRAGAGAA